MIVKYFILWDKKNERVIDTFPVMGNLPILTHAYERMTGNNYSLFTNETFPKSHRELARIKYG